MIGEESEVWLVVQSLKRPERSRYSISLHSDPNIAAGGV
jgi:hypothetical protein